jgi:hypothetical protein
LAGLEPATFGSSGNYTNHYTTKATHNYITLLRILYITYCSCALQTIGLCSLYPTTKSPDYCRRFGRRKRHHHRPRKRSSGSHAAHYKHVNTLFKRPRSNHGRGSCISSFGKDPVFVAMKGVRKLEPRGERRNISPLHKHGTILPPHMSRHICLLQLGKRRSTRTRISGCDSGEYEDRSGCNTMWCDRRLPTLDRR